MFLCDRFYKLISLNIMEKFFIVLITSVTSIIVGFGSAIIGSLVTLFIFYKSKTLQEKLLNIFEKNKFKLKALNL